MKGAAQRKEPHSCAAHYIYILRRTSLLIEMPEKGCQKFITFLNIILIVIYCYCTYYYIVDILNICHMEELQPL